jgi:hypothetical protein
MIMNIPMVGDLRATCQALDDTGLFQLDDHHCYADVFQDAKTQAVHTLCTMNVHRVCWLCLTLLVTVQCVYA